MTATSPNAAPLPPPVDRLPLAALLEHQYRLTQACRMADGAVAEDTTIHLDRDGARASLAILDLLQRMKLREPAVRTALKGT